MRSADEWLEEYSSTHQNPWNKRIHYVCVPLIFWSVLAIFWALPKPAFTKDMMYFNWAVILYSFVLMFYLRLGLPYFFMMWFWGASALLIDPYLAKSGVPVLFFATVIFAIAWLGQFAGHFLEAKKPSFLKDLIFLLIGPLWIAKKIYESITASVQ